MQYRSGSKIVNADALSRAPIPVSPKTVPDPGDLVLLVNNLSRAIVTAESITDPEPTLQPYYSRKEELSIHHGCLLWGTHIVIPLPRRKVILD